MTLDVLVTGFGFIGHHVVTELKQRGHVVAVLDWKPNLSAANELGVIPVVGDVRDAELIRHLVPFYGGVINLAGLLGTSELIDDPAAAVQTNIVGALNVFQGCREAERLGRRVPCVQITVGNHFMNNPYSISKSTSERFAEMFNVEHGTDIRVVRVLNAYGAFQKHRPIRKIIPTFVRAALANEPILVYGDGEQVMDMIYVEDVARILVDALLVPGLSSIISAGTGRRMTVNEIAHGVIRAADSSTSVDHLPMRPGEPERSVVLGAPETLTQLGIEIDSLVDFERGITRTVEWYETNRSFLGL